MTIEELAKEIAKGLVETGIEGGYGSVSCSTAGDYPSIGCSQWEGGRADELLESIPGGEQYAQRTYSDLEYSGDLDGLIELLESDEGQAAQLDRLAEDCETYVETLLEVETLDDSRCMIYAGMWCPTSHYVVKKFLRNRQYEYNIRDLDEMRKLFEYDYATAADCEEYAQGYANRARMTYEYVASLDLSEYGVPPYDGE